MTWRLALRCSFGSGLLRLRRDFLSELARPIELEEALPEALAAAAKEQPSWILRAALEELAGDLARGSGLPEALEPMGDLLSPTARSVIRAAEGTGHLPEAILSLEASAERDEVDAAKLGSTWVGPAISMFVALGVLAIFALHVAPELKAYAGSRGTMPFGLSLMGDWTGWLSLVLLVLGLPLVLLVSRLSRTAAGERVLLALPFLGRLHRSELSMQFCRGVSRSLESGLPLPEALRLVAPVFPAGHRRQVIEQAALQAETGAPTTELFDDAALLSPLLEAAFANPEQSGRLGRSLARLADFQEAERSRLSEEVLQAASIGSLLVAGLLSGLVAVWAWSSYFTSAAAAAY